MRWTSQSRLSCLCLKASIKSDLILRCKVCFSTSILRSFMVLVSFPVPLLHSAHPQSIKYYIVKPRLLWWSAAVKEHRSCCLKIVQHLLSNPVYSLSREFNHAWTRVRTPCTHRIKVPPPCLLFWDFHAWQNKLRRGFGRVLDSLVLSRWRR